MTFAEKIEEWIKEAETRPGSALMILKLIAGRLRDLTERNEELLAENIALENGTRVDEYQKRITHLEYQLALLKKRFGADGEPLSGLPAAQPAAPQALALLAYNASGRMFRFEAFPDSQRAALGRILGEMSMGGEQPRLLALPLEEDVLLMFTSGRVSTLAAADLPFSEAGRSRFWIDAALPDEPHAGELLACLLALSRLPLADFILQVSRRGSVKRTLSSMSESVLANHYLGRGATQKADQAFDVFLCQKKERLLLVSSQGRALALNVDELSYASEERMRLEPTDYIVASFIMPAGAALVCLTQTGKVIERAADDLEVSKSGLARGQALIPPSRLEQGTRFIGALPVGKDDRLVVLDAAGNLTLHTASVLSAAGAIKADGPFLSAALLPYSEGPKP